MSHKMSKKVGAFKFMGWPENTTRPSWGDHSALVVDIFIKSLVTGSIARVVFLEVSRDAIELVRCKRKPQVDEPFTVVFDVGGSRTTEGAVAAAFSQKLNRDYLKEIVEAASRRPEFDARFAGKMIANSVFARGLGI